MGTALEEIRFFRQPGDQLKNNRKRFGRGTPGLFGLFFCFHAAPFSLGQLLSVA